MTGRSSIPSTKFPVRSGRQQRLELLTAEQEGLQSAGHDVAGGLVAPDEDQHRLVDQVLGAERLALGEEQQADQVLGLGVHVVDEVTAAVLGHPIHQADHRSSEEVLFGDRRERRGSSARRSV